MLDIIRQYTYAGLVSPKYRFNVMIEPERLAALREIERRTGATPSEQIRRAIDAHLRSQTVLSKKEVGEDYKGTRIARRPPDVR